MLTKSSLNATEYNKIALIEEAQFEVFAWHV